MAKERFTAENMQYTQTYIDFVSQINPMKVDLKQLLLIDFMATVNITNGQLS